MNDATRAGTQALASPKATARAHGAEHRGRLFRKYLLLILTLVTIALIASGALGIYFTYQETKASLASLQHEKAIAAAARIEQYVHQIEQQLAYAALPQLDPGDVELRRIEFLRLLRQAPEVTDVAQIDASGHERIAVSRLGMDSINSGKDRSQEAAFVETKPGRAWYGPVYFRKETEPYMTIALRANGERGALTVAEVNLKFIWDVISRIRIGATGKAYVVDDKGFLVADPDIGLVLRKTNLAGLAHVKAAFAPREDGDLTRVSTNLAGTPVLTSVAPIESLNWNVFVEQPVSEVYAKLYASIVRAALLLLAGLALSALGALALARGMVRPIRVLAEGAQRIGAGDLDQRIDIRTGDELEALAGRFNDMSAALRESYAGLEQKVETRTRELANALEQQTAISEILRVISSSPTDVKPVLQAVAEHAARLCDAPYARVMVLEGAMLYPMAEYSIDPVFSTNAVPLGRTSITGRAIVDQATVHFADIAAVVTTEFPDAQENVERLGCRAVLAVPLLREGGAYGAIFLYRPEPGLFSTDQVALVQTFARQAVIAIENVRLFNQTNEALERQTAVAEILRVISSSPTDVRPVFDIISERALKLCDAEVSVVARLDGDMIHLGAYRGLAREGRADMENVFPMRLDLNTVTARTIRERRIVEVEDVLDDAAYEGREAATSGPFRGALGVPMLRDGEVIGSILVARRNPGRFSQARIELLKTFADQGAIAIENVRLFNETKDALEQQTAISEILRVIPSSPADVQPVLDAIAEHAAVLCDASAASIYLLDGTVLRHLASKGPSPDPVSHVDALTIDDQTVSGRAFLERRAIAIDDMLAEGRDYPVSFALAQQFNHRTVLVIPLLREGQPFGTILIRRREVRQFGEREIALLRTFGDQAAIALENVRLFNETKEALEQQRASGEVLAAISSSIADTAPVFERILASCTRLFEGKFVGINLVDDNGLVRIAAYHGPKNDALERIFPFPLDDSSAAGRAIRSGSVVHYPDIDDDAADVPERGRTAWRLLGVKAAIGAPMIWEGRGIGVILVGRGFAGRFSDKEIALLKTFADQAAIAIQNARLFREIEEKSRQLEIANKHKSEFLANMSHELRTPLNAIIGFSEVLLERLFGEINDKQDDYLKDIHSSGKHLLSLINDILDLSKIEAGRMELEPSRFDVASAITNALTLVRERAQRHGIALAHDVDPALTSIVADERKFKQILLNLLSNAVKFTPDGGRIDVMAQRVEDVARIAVRDTGIGIAPEDQAEVFEEFRQVGRDYTKKQEGTGLGLALTRRFVELHGGTIVLQSAPGQGSTFTFTIPLEHGADDAPSADEAGSA